METQITKDSILVARYIQGDERALEVLIGRHKSRIYGYIFSKVYDRDATEDIFQDCFIKVIRTLKRGKYNEEGKFLPWVMRIAHNLVIDYFRKNKRMPKFQNRDDFDIFDVLSDGNRNAEEVIIREQIQEDVKALIEELPDDQREVLKMRVYQELSFKEIAYKTDVSINTALGRMRYALINMRKIIEKNNIVLTK